MRTASGLRLGAAAALALSAACSDKAAGPAPNRVNLRGYFILPDSGFVKFYTGGGSQTYLKDTIVDGVGVVDVLRESGQHEYFRRPDRAWVGTLDTAAGGTLFLLQPPLAGIPEALAFGQEVEARSGFVTQTGVVPVRRFSLLLDTGLLLAVPAGSFERVVRIRQEFWVIATNPFGLPDTTIDSAYRWFAPGVDEIRSVQWRARQPDSNVREFLGGKVGGTSYPPP